VIRGFGSPRLLAAAIAAAAAVGAVGAVSCHRADSVLLVEVAGDTMLQVAQLRATITVGTTTRMLTVPATPAAITLPTSFSVELDRSLTGPVTVSIDAYDTTTALVGSGQTTQEFINVGGDTIVVVTLGTTAAAPAAGGN
jgi:hypothetical protein